MWVTEERGCWVTEAVPRPRPLYVEKLILLIRPTNVEGGSMLQVVHESKSILGERYLME